MRKLLIVVLALVIAIGCGGKLMAMSMKPLKDGHPMGIGLSLASMACVLLGAFIIAKVSLGKNDGDI